MIVWNGVDLFMAAVMLVGILAWCALYLFWKLKCWLGDVLRFLRQRGNAR